MAGDEEQDFKGKTYEFLSKPVGVRAAVISAGSILNYLLGLVLFCLIFLIGNPALTSRIGLVMEDYPAAKAGLEKGDLIVSIEGQRVLYWEEVTEKIQRSLKDEIAVTVLREQQEITFRIHPVLEKKQDVFGKNKETPLIGIAASEEVVFVKYQFLSAVKKGTQTLLHLTSLSLKVIWNLITFHMDIRKSLTGPVGIFFITKEAASLGIRYLIQLTAVLSASLAIFNLLPVPVLDGGHLFFLIIEKLRGRPVSKKTIERTSAAGLCLLVVLMLFLIYGDLMRFEVINRIKDFWTAK